MSVVTVCARHGERHEVSERPCHHVAVAGTVTLFAYVGADNTGDVLPDARLFGYDCIILVKI